MQVKNNYDECLTNLACSIRKYFNLEYHHKTLSYIDEILDKEKPRNVLLFLFDGMGSNILDRTLDKESFFIKNKFKKITTVFPATTTAATTSIITGLNPVEHGYLGWNTYIKPINQTITLYLNAKKETGEESEEFIKASSELFKNNSIVGDIQEKKEDSSLSLFPFPVSGSVKYDNLDDFKSKIIEELNKPERSYIYAYNDEPDHTMHLKGPDSKEARKLIKERNDFVEKLCEEISDTLVIVIADHGHIKVDNLYLKDYPRIKSMLERVTSSESRCPIFKVKDEYKNIFPEEFNKEFGEYFKLYSKEDVISSGLYGDGNAHQIFEDALGDYIAISYSDKGLLDTGDEELYSNHAGYTDDEIYVPLIIKLKK